MKIQNWVTPVLALAFFSAGGALLVHEWNAPMSVAAPPDSSVPSWGTGGKRMISHRELTKEDKQKYEAQLQKAKASKLSLVAQKSKPTSAVVR